MTKLDPHFTHDVDGPGAPRGSGRTTKMLVGALDLAKEPQRIVILWHDHDGADHGWNSCLNLLYCNVELIPDGGFAPGRDATSGTKFIEFGGVGSRIDFVSVLNLPGRWLAGRTVGAVSLLEDHHVQEVVNYNRGVREAYAQWQHAMSVVTAMLNPEHYKEKSYT